MACPSAIALVQNFITALLSFQDFSTVFKDQGHFQNIASLEIKNLKFYDIPASVGILHLISI